MKKPLSPALKTFYGIGDLGFSLMTSVGMYFQTYFLTDVAGFNLALVGLIITIPCIFDAVFAPVYGEVRQAPVPANSDPSPCCRPHDHDLHKNRF